MKAKGIVRTVDRLGRVVIPMEMRRTMRVGEGDALEIMADGDGIFMKKYDAAGDLAQVVEKFRKELEAGEYLAPNLTAQMLEKVTEMQEILRKGR